MVLQMQGAIPEMWDEYVYYDEDYEWDNSFTFDTMYEEYEDFVNPEYPDVEALLDSGLSRSEALDVISRIEGECDEYERVMSDWDSFDSFEGYLEFAKSSYNYKTYLALTLLNGYDWAGENDTGIDGESSEIEDGLGDGFWATNYMLLDSRNSENCDVSWCSSDYLFRPAGSDSSVRCEDKLGDLLSEHSCISCHLIPAVKEIPSERHKVWPHPNCIDWGGFNGPGSL